MQTFIAALVSLLILDPVQGAITRQLSALGIPRENAEKVVACARAAAPVVVTRVSENPVWGVTQVIRFWTGAAGPDVVLVEIAPQCTGAVEAAKLAVGRRT
ncbi:MULTISPECIES: hypothetical protein [Bosea]|uniref:Uncharacterized protein n=2 Tax=Bosea TaxID=85413 RepID=A0A927EBD0_9HYPH|nr:MULTISPECIES: hypothetical protein [Bosea]MBD3847357.1 hypothetical protein [Bosea spartocytisi]MCT4475291.1 hypothetical protein [Bosea spartocytisi]